MIIEQKVKFIVILVKLYKIKKLKKDFCLEVEKFLHFGQMEYNIFTSSLAYELFIIYLNFYQKKYLILMIKIKLIKYNKKEDLYRKS